MVHRDSRASCAVGRPQAFRLLVIVLLALTIIFQGWVIQTHIHDNGFTSAVTLQQAGKSKAPLPPSDDPAKCPICQEMLHSGLFVAPAWLAFFLIVAANPVVRPVLAAVPAFTAISHTWRSRAPPRI